MELQILQEHLPSSIHIELSGFGPIAAGIATLRQLKGELRYRSIQKVILIGIGDKKIQVIKEVRAITSLGLKEAKELVESAPKAIKEGVTKDEAAQIKEKIEAVGGQVDIK